MKPVITTFVTIFVLAILSVFAVMYSGIFNVAATETHSALVQWIVSTTRETSIEKNAKTIKAPDLGDTKRLENGFRSYREMCAICHTPPGAEDSPIAQGLNPQAPNLAREAAELGDTELFWVIKNGIRMTGMPAWGVTHGDEELWDIVAFVKALPEMSVEQYKALNRTTEAGHHHGANDHENGDHDDGAGNMDSHDPGNHKVSGHDADGHEHGEHQH